MVPDKLNRRTLTGNELSEEAVHAMCCSAYAPPPGGSPRVPDEEVITYLTTVTVPPLTVNSPDMSHVPVPTESPLGVALKLLALLKPVAFESVTSRSSPTLPAAAVSLVVVPTIPVVELNVIDAHAVIALEPMLTASLMVMIPWMLVAWPVRPMTVVEVPVPVPTLTVLPCKDNVPLAPAVTVMLLPDVIFRVVFASKVLVVHPELPKVNVVAVVAPTVHVLPSIDVVVTLEFPSAIVDESHDSASIVVTAPVLAPAYCNLPDVPS